MDHASNLVLFECGRCGIKSLIPEKNAAYIRFFENANGKMNLSGCICLTCWEQLQKIVFKGGKVDV